MTTFTYRSFSLNYLMPEAVSLVQVANVPRVREGNQSGVVENNMVQTGSYSLHSNEGRCFSGWELCAALVHISNNKTIAVIGAIPCLNWHARFMFSRPPTQEEGRGHFKRRSRPEPAFLFFPFPENPCKSDYPRFL
jgi:hypothetical protein